MFMNSRTQAHVLLRLTLGCKFVCELHRDFAEVMWEFAGIEQHDWALPTNINGLYINTWPSEPMGIGPGDRPWGPSQAVTIVTSHL